jgi:cytochrome P450
MAEFADPYPARVIATVLGVPPGDFGRFLGLATDLGLGFGPAVVQHLPRTRWRSGYGRRLGRNVRDTTTLERCRLPEPQKSDMAVALPQRRQSS